MVMTFVGGLGGLGWFQILLQTRKSLLGAGQIARLQTAGQALIIGVSLAVLAKRLAGRGLRTTLHGLLKSCQRALGAREVARLQGGADGIEILNQLAKTALIGGLVGAGGRSHAGNATHRFWLNHWWFDSF